MIVLTAPDIHANNTFAQPNAVAPRADDARTTPSSVVVTIPAASVEGVEKELV